jgi:hypothetical protein
MKGPSTLVGGEQKMTMVTDECLHTSFKGMQFRTWVLAGDVKMNLE